MLEDDGILSEQYLLLEVSSNNDGIEIVGMNP